MGESRALLLRSVPRGESDLILTFFTELDGVVSLAMRGGKASKRRAGGALEPFHTVQIAYELRGEIGTLKQAELLRPRVQLTTQFEALNCAGTLLRWLRFVLPAHAPEPALFSHIERTLDALATTTNARILLAQSGFELLDHIGYGLNLTHCVQCGKARPQGKAGRVSPQRGGIVCRECGDAGIVISGKTLDEVGISESAAEDLLPLIEQTLTLHTGMKHL